MTTPQRNRELNDVLISVGNSLLQYVGECWPWTPEDAASIHPAMESLIERQKQQIARIVDLLVARAWPIEFGTYPTDYTDLHFVALDYLLPQLVDGEQALIDELEQARLRCSDDPEAQTLLAEIQDQQREIVLGLQDIQRTLRSQSAIS